MSNTGTESPFAGTVINVKDYGAVGDGTADDTNGLRDAIAASKKGYGIYFPPGTYVIKESLVPKAQQVYFSLTDAAVIKANPDCEPFAVFDVQSGRPVEFHHLTLDLSKPKDTEPPDCDGDAPPGIFVQAAGNATVDLVVSSCRIRHCHAQGILVRATGKPGRRDRVIVRDSLVEDCCESGLTLNRVNGARVEGSRFECCRNGIQAASCRDVAIYAVVAAENRRHGIAFRFSYEWHVSTCVAKSNGGGEQDQEKLRGWGIAAGGGPEDKTPNSDFTITDNICEDNYAGGITLDPTEADDPTTPEDESAVIFPQRARISGNVCRGRKGGKPLGGDIPFGVHGIHVRNSRDVVATDNLCHENHNCGIALVNDAHVLVQANACYENLIGIGLFSRTGLEDPGNNVVGVNMLYDNENADLKGMP
jgi:parallel beta-helix repeat protein